MNTLKHLSKMKSLLSQALNVAQHNMSSDKTTNNAKMHIKKAIKELDKGSKRKKIPEEYSNWWSNIEAGTVAAATSPMSQEAQQKSLDQLNSMIEQEKDKLKELEISISEDKLLQE